MRRMKQKTENRRRALAFVLSAALLIGLVPASSLAFEGSGHVHNENGWTCEKGPLICELDENVESPESEVVEENKEPQLICGMDEDELICGQEAQIGDAEDEESEPGHSHSGDCYHTHKKGCYSQEEEKESFSKEQEPSHVHADECYEWNCTAPAGEAAGGAQGDQKEEKLENENVILPAALGSTLSAVKTTREAMDLTGEISGLKGTILLNGTEISNGAVIPEKDLIGGTLKVNFEFDLPVGEVQYGEGGQMIHTGAPIPGDQIFFSLPEMFGKVSGGGVEAADFVVRVDENGIKEITIGALTWEEGQLVLTFNEEMERQDRWIYLDQCKASAEIWYDRNGEGEQPGETEVTFFDKTFIIQREDSLSGDYQLRKTVVDQITEEELGGSVIYSRLTNTSQQNSVCETPNPGAIGEDGTVVWKVVVTPQKGAALNGMSLREIPGKNLTIEGITCEIGGVTSGTGEWNREKNVWAFPEEGKPLTGAATFLITTKINPQVWYLQSGSAWTEQMKITNGVKLQSSASQDGGVRDLLSAEASVSFARQMLVKYGANNWNTNTQTWTVRVNGAGRKVEGAYVVDQLNEKLELRGTDPILVDGVSIPAITSQAAAEAKTPGYWIEFPDGGKTKITIYLGKITGPKSIQVATKTKDGVVEKEDHYILKNDAWLYGDFEGTTDRQYGYDYESFTRSKPGLVKKGNYSSATDRIRWTVTAQANSIPWQDAYLADLIVPGSELSLSEEQWIAFEAIMTENMGGTTKAAASIVKKYQANPALAATGQKLAGDFAKSLTVEGLGNTSPSAGVIYGTIKTDGTVQISTIGAAEDTSAYFILAKIGEKKLDGTVNNGKVTLSFETQPVHLSDADAKTSWINWAALYRSGTFVQSKGETDAGKGKTYLSKSWENYDYETHQASWIIEINPKKLNWDSYLPVSSTAVIADQLPEGWTLQKVELVDGQGNAVTVAGVTDNPNANEITWEVPEDLRTGNAHLSYRVTAVIADPENYLAEEIKKVLNQAELWVDDVLKDSDSCEFTIHNRKPQKTAEAVEGRQIKWTIQVNEGYVPYGSARVEDDLPEGLIPVFEDASEEALRPKVEAWYLSRDLKGNMVKGEPAAVTAGYNSQSNTIFIDLPEPGKGYWLEFTSRIYGPTADSYANTARFIANGSHQNSETASIKKAQIIGESLAAQVGTISIKKTNAKTGREIDGAVFRLTSPTDSKYIRETVSVDGIARFEHVPYGTYQLAEVKPAPGYEINEEFNQTYASFSMGYITDTQLGMNLECLNQQSAFEISFLKQDYDTGRALAGVEFALYDNEEGTGTPLRVKESDAYGYVSFTDLAQGTYYLYETKPLPGYAPWIGSICKAVIDSEGNASYTNADGVLFEADDMFNGVTPVLTNRKAAAETIRGIKYLSGRSLNSGEFTFALFRNSDEEEVGVVQNGADGHFSFRLIFTEADAGTEQNPQTHEYTILEKAGNLSGITYDQTIYTYRVNVWKDDQGNIRTGDSILYINAPESEEETEALTAAAFHNRYTGGHSDKDKDKNKDKGKDRTPNPSGGPEDEIIIPDEDVPLGSIPEEETGASSEVIVIADDETPLGGVALENGAQGLLPKTGLVVGTAEQFFLLGLALIALGLGLRIRKKKEE